ncbi:MAG: MFS transporter [Bacteroidales bacterium]|nr:MFS transporter [Bacteroidales bacterium]MCF8404999.1 MFS transporter [Bacteroidales bacterium]
MFSFKSFPHTFWVANTMELFERWAYYGMFAVLSVYLTDPISKGGLGFSQEQRGIMQAVVTGVLYLLPILGGAIADRYGFRKVLLAAFVTLSSGYFAMGQSHAYAPVFISFLVVAIGGAIFKPIIVGTVSKTTDKSNETVGFGIFYMIVNIGGFIGPWAASKMRELNWTYVFLMCSGVILINLILLFFYHEPKQKEKKSTPLLQTIKQIFSNTLLVLKDTRFVLFLLILVGFWTMYMQLFFTIPVYIGQWINTTVIYDNIGYLTRVFGAEDEGLGIIRPEMMINIPALTIIIFQVFISNRLMNVRPVTSMVGGIFIVMLGLGSMYFHLNGWYVALSLLILAFGEMASSPRIQEYISGIAPPDKIGLYMGYSFLPIAGGNILGGLLSGKLYGSMSDKYIFLRDYIVVNNITVADSVAEMDGAELFSATCMALDLQAYELNTLLYNIYHPGEIWLVFGGIGLLTGILLFMYNKFLLPVKQ